MKNDRMVRRAELQQLTGLSYSTLYRYERAGSFPGRVRLGEQAVGWWLSQVLAWLEDHQVVGREHHYATAAKHPGDALF